MTVPPDAGADEFDLFPDPAEPHSEPVGDRNPEETPRPEPDFLVSEGRGPGITWRAHRDTTLDAMEADPHDENELQAAQAQSCARCGRPIQSGDEVRRRPDGSWVHEVCPQPTA